MKRDGKLKSRLCVQGCAQTAGIDYDQAEVEFAPSVSIAADASQAAKVLSLVDALEDSDDVQNVFTNMDLTPDVLAALDAEDG